MNTAQGVRKRAVQVASTLGLQAVVLFAASGRIDWVWAWAYLGANVVGIAAIGLLIMRPHPELMAERAESRGQKGWDRVVGGLWALLYFLGTLLIAGLDVRLGWTGPLSPALPLAGGAAYLLGAALFAWAMAANAFFSAVVRIQSERGHSVCSEGPYRIVRHPGYTGAVLQSLAAPIFLGSPWALIPGGLAAALMIVRAALEDRTLQRELLGYAAYAARVRYRLVPGVW